MAKEIESLRATAADAKADREALSSFATQALADAPQNVQAFIKATIGDNPRAVLKALAAAKANGMLGAQPIPAGADTTQSAAPKPAEQSDGDLLAAKRFRELNGRAADVFYTLNSPAIERGLQKLQGRN